jgi:hypothetical protein
VDRTGLERLVNEAEPETWESVGNGPEDEPLPEVDLDDEPDAPLPGDEQPEWKTPGKGPSQAKTLLGLAESATYFHTPDGKAYATVRVGDHDENLPVGSSDFKKYLSRLLYVERHIGASSEALQTAINTLTAKAIYDGEQREVHLRVADATGPDGPVYYLDLEDERRRAVKITREGWEVVDAPPVKFRRSKSMRQLPVPERGGSIDDLREFVNVGTDSDWRLFVAVACDYLRPTGPYPVLVIQGEQGSAKSTTSRLVCRLIDPSENIRTLSKDDHHMAIAARNSWVVSFDNLSGLPDSMSDTLCRLSTGQCFSTRTLYETEEETIFSFKRPVVLNGIDDIARKSDLLERSVVLVQPRISSDARRTEEEFWGRFDASSAKILGALLEAVVGALRMLPEVHLSQLPRMADFARFGEALGRALGWGDGTFLGDLSQNQGASSATLLRGCLVALAIIDLMKRQVSWCGTATDLLTTLRSFVPHGEARSREFPKTPSALAGKLRRLGPALLGEGITIGYNRSSQTRSISINNLRPDKDGKTSSPSSSASLDASNPNNSNGLGKEAGGEQGPSLDRHESVTDRHSSSSGESESDFRKSISDNDLDDYHAFQDDDHDADDDVFPGLTGDTGPGSDEEEEGE